jgi:co-chaperonin GroES (HSP10)
VGRVLKVGNLAYQDDKFSDGAWCKEGDYICYGKHSGNKFMYKGVQLLLIFDDDVKMVVEDAKDLDPTFNLTN